MVFDFLLQPLLVGEKAVDGGIHFSGMDVAKIAYPSQMYSAGQPSAHSSIPM